MTTRGQDIASVIKKQIEEYGSSASMVNVGVVTEVGDAIANIHGLSGVQLTELLEFPGGVIGMAMNLEEDSVSAVILGDDKEIAEGNEVRSTGRIAEVPVGDTVIGRVMNALGEPIDGRGAITSSESRPVEKVAPNVVSRQAVNTPMQTGIKAIDSMIPIGRGQRELIIGDRQTGKTAIALDAIINQKGTGVTCVYVAVGQKQSSIAAVVRKLEEYGAMEHTIIVAAAAADPAPMQFLAPYSGCSMGEYFRDKGEDALIIYDDLSKQAVAYRQISLLLRRPPGREAYPGDIFYLHSRLLERGCRVNEDYVEEQTEGKVKGKTGSLTALPIIETQAGDVSAFVPTNVISITDGQIFLETSYFNKGLLPAMNPGISVSRVGGAAQTPLIKKLGGGVRIALAQFRELEAFAQFASDLDDASREQLELGQKVTELMKQKQYSPMSVSEMGLVLFAVDKGYLKDVELNKIADFESALISYMNSEHKDFMDNLAESGEHSDEILATFTEALDKFKATQTW